MVKCVSVQNNLTKSSIANQSSQAACCHVLLRVLAMGEQCKARAAGE